MGDTTLLPAKRRITPIPHVAGRGRGVPSSARTGNVSDTVTLERARTALDEHAWSEAYAALSSLDHEGGLGGADLERLGEAAWWNAHPRESLDAFARSYVAYVAEGDPTRAAFVALRLAFEHFETRDIAQWNGWMGRATRLLQDQPESAVHGYLELQRARGFILLGQGSSDEPAQRVARILEIGRRFGDRDLEAFGLVLQGWLLVMGAQVERGLALVDEAAVAAVEGELTPHTAGAVYCITIGVCRTVADYRRASEWTEAATRWCERESVSGFPGICRIHRAEIMRLRGAFSDAESEAREALAQLTAFGMSSPRDGATTRSARSACGWVISTARRRRSSTRISWAKTRSRASPSCTWPVGGSGRPARRSRRRCPTPRRRWCGRDCSPPVSRSRSPPTILPTPARPPTSWLRSRGPSTNRSCTRRPTRPWARR
jgi:hypothetical protein